jgi:hypothetical protein
MGRINEEEINTLLDALSTGAIDDAGLKSSVSGATMRQKDIDLLVGVIQELQEYQKIGTVKECEEYKRIALAK